MSGLQDLDRRQQRTTKCLSVIALTILLGGFLGGCNTTEGFGQDMQQAGKDIENSAEKHK
jgi:predicted small secreted protein